MASVGAWEAWGAAMADARSMTCRLCAHAACSALHRVTSWLAGARVQGHTAHARLTAALESPHIVRLGLHLEAGIGESLLEGHAVHQE